MSNVLDEGVQLTAEELRDSVVLRELSRHVYLVNLYVSWPKLQYRIDGAIVAVARPDSEQVADERPIPQRQKMDSR